jgi:hypothetical protein
MGHDFQAATHALNGMRSQGPSDSSGGYFPLDIAPCLARR